MADRDCKTAPIRFEDSLPRGPGSFKGVSGHSDLPADGVQASPHSLLRNHGFYSCVDAACHLRGFV